MGDRRGWAELRPHNVDVLNLMLGRTDTPVHRQNLARRGLPVQSSERSIIDAVTRSWYTPNWNKEDNRVERVALRVPLEATTT